MKYDGGCQKVIERQFGPCMIGHLEEAGTLADLRFQTGPTNNNEGAPISLTAGQRKTSEEKLARPSRQDRMAE
jgi:hypothetical protein